MLNSRDMDNSPQKLKRGAPRKYDYNKAAELLKSSSLTDREISEQTGIPEKSIQQYRKRCSFNTVTATGATGNVKQKVKKDPGLKDLGYKASARYIQALRNTKRAITPLAERILFLVHKSLDEDLETKEILQLSQILLNVQKLTSDMMGDTEQAILTLLDYELLGENQTALLFEAIDESMIDFQTRTKSIFENRQDLQDIDTDAVELD